MDPALIALLIEVLLPILLELLEDSPEQEALANMKNPGLYVRLRIKSKLRGLTDVLADAAVEKLKSLTDEERLELLKMSKVKKAA